MTFSRSRRLIKQWANPRGIYSSFGRVGDTKAKRLRVRKTHLTKKFHIFLTKVR